MIERGAKIALHLDVERDSLGHLAFIGINANYAVNGQAANCDGSDGFAVLLHALLYYIEFGIRRFKLKSRHCCRRLAEKRIRFK